MGRKKKIKAIKAIAAGVNLPLVMSNTTELHLVKGSELIEQGQTHIGEMKIIPELDYPIRMPVQIAFNHGRRLKRAFTKNGAEGIGNYLNKINHITKKYLNER